MGSEIIREQRRFIFGRIVHLANRLQVLGDQVLSEEMTIRQWLLTATIAQYKKPPSLSTLSEAMGSSHQNIKQLATNLKEKGFLRIEKDKTDKRSICFILEEKCYKLWEERQEEIRQFLARLFQDMANEEIERLSEIMNKLSESLSQRQQ